MLEEKIQSESFIWHWNTFPEERGLLHANNNNSHNSIRGNRNKALGVVAGVADMEYFKNGKVYLIEFKTKHGSQSQEQKDWQKLVESEGFEYRIVRTIAEFKEFITSIQNDRT